MKIKTYYSLLLLIIVQQAFAQPTGFVDEQVSQGWTVPVGLTFDKQGRMFVWEKAGKVFIVENAVKDSIPIIDISEEVLDFNDHGLNGLALDPNFQANGYIYLMYAVKRHHALYYGTPEYDSTNTDNFKTTIGRITRYQLNVADNFKTLNPDSRKILLGESITTGIPILVDNHGVGSLVFAKDGTLLATAGDAALTSEPPVDDTQNPWFLEAISLGIITVDQNINAYRSQSLNSLNGKLLRIDPNTGDGITSNPFFDASKPRSTSSRIWAYGLRNPFRFDIQPNTGSQNPADGNPGTIFVGDVGWTHREEINIISKGGQNFGWPTYEGMSHMNNSYADAKYKPANHVLPIVEWRGPLAQGLIDGEPYGVGSSQFKGKAFTGNSSIGGIFYTLKTFPEAYQNLYFQGDYEGWVKAFRLDNKNNPIEVIDFGDNVNPTCFALNPVDGSIYYVNFLYPNISEVRKISYNPSANLRPLAVAEASIIYGTSPLTVKLTGSNSKDPEGGPIKFFWDFGNGESTDLANPTHIYKASSTGPQTFTATLKVTDNLQKTDTKSIKIFLNNTPPKIVSTAIDGINSFSNAKDLVINLSANVSDNEQTNLAYQWLVVLHHDEHTHFVTSLKSLNGQITLSQVPCDEQKYFYRVSLTVTENDPVGLSTVYQKDITPICGNVLSISPNPTSDIINLTGDDALDTYLMKVSLLHTTGKVISQKEGFWNEIKAEINTHLMAQSYGIYLLNIIYGDKNKTFKILKQ